MVISFYSYKGGTGRSLTLLNIAAILCQNGKRVGVFDLDVESAGLHHILGLEPKENEGLLDLLLGGHVPFVEKISINVAKELGENWQKNGFQPKGAFYLLPTISDVVKLGRLNWTEYTITLLGTILGYFAKIFELELILIDSRTGFSPSGENALRLADKVVLVFRLNRQNIYGVKKLAKGYEAAGIPFFLVASCVPEIEEKNKYIVQYQKELGRSVDAILPYDQNLAFEEKISAIVFPNSELSKELKRLADLVAKE
jgi:MinD-like ATPase involved in chromosome partitioning or flagellar assembly